LEASPRGSIQEFGDLSTFSVRSLLNLHGAVRYMSETLRQLAILIRGSTHLLALLSIGMGFGLINFGYYFLRSAGAADYTGLLAGIGIPRATVGMAVGYVLSAKVGGGIVSEIGAMRINEEIDALEVGGIDSIQYLVATRVAAMVLYAPIATAVLLLSQFGISYFVAVDLLHAVPPATFNQYAWGYQAVPDQLFALGIVTAICLNIVLVGCYYGYRVSGGPAAIGSAVARALLVNLVMVHVILGVGDFLVYGKNLGLPIGG
jgi:phospholipid/cholesterol/gamma-HCH transport system permease protein